LTRSMDSKPSVESSEKETPKRLAFSVENILDPTKFTGKKRYGQGVNGSRMWNNIERDDKMDDDQSDDRSSEYLLWSVFCFSFFYLLWPNGNSNDGLVFGLLIEKLVE
jgi:hypothetical protein